MISQQHRAMAKDVASGCPASPFNESVKQKVVTYGFLAQAAAKLVLPTASELLGDRRPGYVGAVTSMLGDNLIGRFDQLLEEDPELHDKIETATTLRKRQLYGLGSEDAAKENFRGGVNTAMDIESATLATIRMRTVAGEEITRDGLMKSQRVPFAFAMQSLGDLDLEHGSLFDRVYLPDAHLDGVETREKVLKPDFATLSQTQGLRLSSDIPQWNGYSRFTSEPTVGCPVTLVKHFVRDLHAVAAEACIQAGIIEVTDLYPTT
jgi:hypothetical protein